jgi:hypothetical protein
MVRCWARAQTNSVRPELSPPRLSFRHARRMDQDWDTLSLPWVFGLRRKLAHVEENAWEQVDKSARSAAIQAPCLACALGLQKNCPNQIECLSDNKSLQLCYMCCCLYPGDGHSTPCRARCIGSILIILAYFAMSIPPRFTHCAGTRPPNETNPTPSDN